MLLNRLNLNQILIFEAVYRTLSMTSAARELHLTQSGVSQHIAALEESLGIPLFERTGRKLVPTSNARDLYEACATSLGTLESSLQKIKGVHNALSGTISVGMPIEFGNHVILPLLSKFASQHPDVRFRIQLGFASDMNQQLLSGQMDVAFVDEFQMDKSVMVEQVTDEMLELCISRSRLPKLPSKQDRKFFESLEYVDYQKDEPVLRRWFEHHFGQRGFRLNVRATVMDVQGILRLILSGMGAGIIPSYVFERLKKEGYDVIRFNGSGKPLRNTIRLAYVKNRPQTPATAAVITALRDALRKKNTT